MITANLGNNIIEHLSTIEKDSMSIFVMADGLIRGALFHGTKFVNQMRSQHKTGILETMILGQASLCGALMIPTMKGKEHLKIRYDTNGPAAGFSIEADSTGYVRGFLLQDQIPIDKPLESWDLSPFFGEGTLSVSRFPEGRMEPQTGTVEIKSRNIAQDLSWYFQQSEQLNTAFNTSIQFDKQGSVIGAGGLFLQVIPQTGGYSSRNKEIISEELSNQILEKVENAFSACPSLGQWYAEKGKSNDIIYGLFREFSPTVVLERDVIYDCPCSKETYVKHILNLGKSELHDILDDKQDPLQVICHNCGSVYEIYKQDLINCIKN